MPPVIRRNNDTAEAQMSQMEPFLAQAAVLEQLEEDSGAVDKLLQVTDGIYPDNARVLLGLDTTDSVHHSAAQIRAAAREIARNLYAGGNLADRSQVDWYNSVKAVVIGDRDTTEVLAAELADLPRVRDALGQEIRRHFIRAGEGVPSEAEIKAVYNVIDRFLVANLIYDANETTRRRLAAEAQVAIYKRTVLKGERIVDSHEILSQKHVDALISYSKARQLRGGQSEPWRPLTDVAGKTGVTLLVLGAGVIFLVIFRPRLVKNTSWLLLMVFLVIGPLYVASFIASIPNGPAFAVPVVLTAILATVLFDAEVGLALSSVVVLLAGVILGHDFRFVLVNAPAIAVPMLLMRRVRHRSEFLRAMVVLPLVYVVSIASIDSLIFVSQKNLWGRIWPAALGGALMPVLAIGLLPICERVFGITTPITLLELSDLNRPLLRELALKSPGTYTHSIIIANLAERAAEAVGGDQLLARVGSYYHDIGKIAKPDHFVENQLGGRNPHDKLTPAMSALVLANHVREGIRITQAYGLPKAITDFVPQHHGTVVMAFFYDKASKLYGPESVDQDTFRYPGPRPQTKEAAILMLADAAEAATRSLQDRSPSRIKGLVRQILRDRLDDGQFDECDVTLRDLSRIEESFLPVLAGTLHGRIAYPDQPTPRKPRPSPSMSDV